MNDVSFSRLFFTVLGRVGCLLIVFVTVVLGNEQKKLVGDAKVESGRGSTS